MVANVALQLAARNIIGSEPAHTALFLKILVSKASDSRPAPNHTGLGYGLFLQVSWLFLILALPTLNRLSVANKDAAQGKQVCYGACICILVHVSLLNWRLI